MEKLVDAIYEAIVDQEIFDFLPRKIAEICGATSGWFLSTGNDGVKTQAQFGFDDSMVASYEAYYHTQDLWLREWPNIPVGRGVSLERFVPHAVMASSEFYNDYLRFNGDYMFCAGLIFDRRTCLGIQRDSKGEAFGIAEERRLQSLRPHLARLWKVRARHRTLRMLSDLPEFAFQSFDDAIFICSSGGKVLHLNNEARALVERRIVELTPDSLLDHLAGTRRDLFQHALRRATVRSVSSDGAIFISDGNWRVAVDRDPDRRNIVVVRLRDMQRERARQLSHAVESFLFTPSETALADSLLKGRSVEEHAALRGTAVSTVRSQLRELLEKSGTMRQAALVALILSF